MTGPTPELSHFAQTFAAPDGTNSRDAASWTNALEHRRRQALPRRQGRSKKSISRSRSRMSPSPAISSGSVCMNPSDGLLKRIQEHFGLHPLAVEDCARPEASAQGRGLWRPSVFWSSARRGWTATRSFTATPRSSWGGSSSLPFAWDRTARTARCARSLEATPWLLKQGTDYVLARHPRLHRRRLQRSCRRDGGQGAGDGGQGDRQFPRVARKPRACSCCAANCSACSAYWGRPKT